MKVIGYPGMAVKMVDGKVDKILLGFDKAKEYLKHKENTMFVGNPTSINKIEITKERKKEILNDLGLDENIPTIIVTGGSQGAQKLNESILELIAITKGKELGSDFQIIFSTGKKHYDSIIKDKTINNESIRGLKVMPYIFNMEEILNICDMSICRSGAMTVTELLKVQIPAIFIPLPTRNQNNQEANTEVFKKNDMGIVIRNDEVTGKKLYDEIMKIIKGRKIGYNEKKYSKIHGK